MNTPNKPTHADTLKAREIVKARNHPAHHRAIDAGDWDEFRLVQGALTEMIREREEEEGEE